MEKVTSKLGLGRGEIEATNVHRRHNSRVEGELSWVVPTGKYMF